MSKENELKPFEKIYLQSEDNSFYGLEGTTWCQDQINETDVKYIHSDVVDKLKQELEEAKNCFISVQSAIHAYSSGNYTIPKCLSKIAFLAQQFLSKHESEG